MAVVAPKRPGIGTTLALAAMLAYAIVWGVWAVANWDVLAGAIFGWNGGYDEATISYVTPNYPADRAGIKAGDRLDWAALPLIGRNNLANNASVEPGTQLTVSVSHGNQSPRTVTLHAEPWETHTLNAARVGFVANFVLAAIGAVLVWLRPSRMTWGFLLFAYPWEFWFFAQSEPWKFVLLQICYALFNGAWATGLFMFVSRFPTDRPRGILVYLDRIAIPYGTCIAGISLAFNLLLLLSAQPPPRWLVVVLENLVSPLTTVVAAIGLIVSFASAKGSDRQRIAPVLVVVAALLAVNLASAYYNFFYTGGAALNAIVDASDGLLIVLALVVANGVVRHRVIDISFTLSRTLVYTILTTFLVAVFALIDFVSAKIFEHFAATIVLEAIAALIFAFSINAIHHRVDAFIDSVLFRRRHLAEERLNRAGKTLSHAESEAFIDEALVIEAGDALDLASAAVFRQKGDVFERDLAAGWNGENAATIPHDDHLVVNLRSELAAIDLLTMRWPRTDLPADERHPILAIPLVVRNEVLGFVLYGGHNGGEAIDPDERTTLVTLTQAAASAYETLRARDLLAESNELRSEVTVLHEKEALLREMVDALKKA